MRPRRPTWQQQGAQNSGGTQSLQNSSLNAAKRRVLAPAVGAFWAAGAVPGGIIANFFALGAASCGPCKAARALAGQKRWADRAKAAYPEAKRKPIQPDACA